MTRVGRNKGQNVVKWILNALIVVMCFFFLLTAAMMVESCFDAYSQPYKNEDMFYYQVEEERYSYLINCYYRNTFSGFEGNADEQEYYGIAKYYEAAVLYRAYDVYGREEWADKFLERMEAAEEDMGGWDITREPIHEQLGIE